MLGDHVVQRGSNVTAERLRFDFSHPAKMTPDQIEEVERIVNAAIEHDWPMGYRELPTAEAFAEGALGAFGDKYGETVKVYTAGDPLGAWYSKEICGGPHVGRTGVLGRFRIQKEESSGAGVAGLPAGLVGSAAPSQLPRAGARQRAREFADASAGAADEWQLVSLVPGASSTTGSPRDLGCASPMWLRLRSCRRARRRRRARSPAGADRRQQPRESSTPTPRCRAAPGRRSRSSRSPRR